MKKVIFKLNKPNRLSEAKERITIQLRDHDKNGVYDKKNGAKSNFTIWLKDCSINEANEIIKAALMNSPHIDKQFEVEE
jgi:hypothetical protein